MLFLLQIKRKIKKTKLISRIDFYSVYSFIITWKIDNHSIFGPT